ncbi:MAG: methyltransferase [Proteobacteria bacterium]|jgi:tRNA1(Val) A37 N6-methylase TrmN6|nr:methyltransferase [Pseudomonadota bacterium]
MNYQQPEFFRFGFDSIWLSDMVKRNCEGFIPKKILELGAGSGVISCELGAHFPEGHFICLELQEAFLPFLKANLEHYLKQRHEVISQSVAQFNLTKTKTFDLIIFNPPYFETTASRPSPILEREICRKHVVDTWDDWMACVERSLTAQGQVFWVHRREMPGPEGFIVEKISTQNELGVWRARRLYVE